jgi:hypothetical protein
VYSAVTSHKKLANFYELVPFLFIHTKIHFNVFISFYGYIKLILKLLNWGLRARHNAVTINAYCFFRKEVTKFFFAALYIDINLNAPLDANWKILSSFCLSS